MVSEAHGFDVAVPLLSSPPPQELEEGAENDTEAPRADGGEGAPPREAREPSPAEKKKTSSPPVVQAPAKGAEQATNQELCDGCDGASTEKSDSIVVWEEQEAPASKESFFFTVPPLSELVGLPGCPDGQNQDAAAAAAAATAAGIPGDQSAKGKPQPALTSPTSPGGGREDQDAEDTAAAPEEVNTTVSLLVSLNGSDWQPVSGPSLTYFQPPPEPVVEPEEETKKGKGKKK